MKVISKSDAYVYKRGQPPRFAYLKHHDSRLHICNCVKASIHRHCDQEPDPSKQGYLPTSRNLFLSLSLGMLHDQAHSPALRQRKRRLTFALLSAWLSVSFGPTFFARSLSIEVAGWPVHFWIAAQGSILVFITIVVVYAWLMNRWEAQEGAHRIDETL